MKKRILMVLAALVLCAAMMIPAMAEQAVSTTLVMRVSHMTQNAVVNVGEDFSMDVGVNGVEPASYQWYFADQPIADADQKTLNIVNASVEDIGVYRLDAFDADGNLLVSMEISLRVIDPDAVPKAGDDSLSVNAAIAMVACAFGVMLITAKRRVRA